MYQLQLDKAHATVDHIRCVSHTLAYNTRDELPITLQFTASLKLILITLVHLQTLETNSFLDNQI